MGAARRSRGLVVIAVLGALVVACGGGATQAPASSTTGPGAATATPAGGGGGGGGGGTTVAATLTGGADAGSYTTGADPLCTVGYAGEGAWGVQYSTADASVKFSSFQFVGPVPGSDAKSYATVTIGPLTGGKTYDFGENVGGTWSVSDNGSTAVITAEGTTADGVQVKVVVNCPSVARA